MNDNKINNGNFPESGKPAEAALEMGKAPECSENLHFPKSERLRHKVLVDSLFAMGETLYEYPLRLTFRSLGEEELAASFKVGVPDRIAPLQLLITIPKKKRRHAVDRVLMRRRIREAWRLRRRQLRLAVEENPELRTLSVGIVYMSSKNSYSNKICSKMDILISKLTEIVKERRYKRPE